MDVIGEGDRRRFRVSHPPRPRIHQSGLARLCPRLSCVRINVPCTSSLKNQIGGIGLQRFGRTIRRKRRRNAFCLASFNNRVVKRAHDESYCDLRTYGSTTAKTALAEEAGAVKLSTSPTRALPPATHFHPTSPRCLYEGPPRLSCGEQSSNLLSSAPSSPPPDSVRPPMALRTDPSSLKHDLLTQSQANPKPTRSQSTIATSSHPSPVRPALRRGRWKHMTDKKEQRSKPTATSCPRAPPRAQSPPTSNKRRD